MKKTLNQEKSNMKTRMMLNVFFKYLFFFATLLGLFILFVLLYRIFTQGIGSIDWQFFTDGPSRFPEKAGILPALVGTIWLMAVVAPLTVIIGVATAIYLEEYAPRNAITSFIKINISNLSGVPAIVFGLLGLTIFARTLSLGNSILAAGLTLSVLVLPVVIVSSQEALKSVSKSLHEASYAMGATKWQTISRVVLPAALPGVVTGTILSLSRAIGEASPLIVIGVPLFINYLPSTIFDAFTTMPMQIYNWAGRPKEAFQELAAGGILVLLVVLILMNSIAIYIRNRYQKRY